MNSMRSMKELRVGGQISANEMNRLFEVAGRITNTTATPPVELVKGATGYHIRYNTELVFPAQITAVTTEDETDRPVYDWTERSFDIDGKRIDHPNPRTGTSTYSPAFETNDAVIAEDALPMEVWMRPMLLSEDRGPTYEFQASLRSGANQTIRVLTCVAFRQASAPVVEEPPPPP